MSDDVLAAMGIAGFGKASKKRQLDPHRFDKNKRVEVRRAIFRLRVSVTNSCTN